MGNSRLSDAAERTAGWCEAEDRKAELAPEQPGEICYGQMMTVKESSLGREPARYSRRISLKSRIREGASGRMRNRVVPRINLRLYARSCIRGAGVFVRGYEAASTHDPG